MRVLSVVGARPQFIKLGPFSRELRNYHQEIIIHTGQHYDANMSGLFFEQLGIPEPDINLQIGSGNHGKQTGRMLIALEEEFIRLKPDAVVVFGDTNSTLAGALASSKLHIPCVHIEAGLRSFNPIMPEEINRIVADHISDLLLAPTHTAMHNLKREDLDNKSTLTGDIMVDSVQYLVKKAEHNSVYPEKLGLRSGNYYLLTLHRPSNVDDPQLLQNLIRQLSELDYPVVFPVHPRTRKSLPDSVGEMHLIDPVGYLDILSLQRNARKIITDSGGIQKEAYILGTPCNTLRSETEWTETVEAGWNQLINPKSDELVTLIKTHNPVGKPPEVFGEKVAPKMVTALERIC